MVVAAINGRHLYHNSVLFHQISTTPSAQMRTMDVVAGGGPPPPYIGYHTGYPTSYDDRVRAGPRPRTRPGDEPGAPRRPSVLGRAHIGARTKRRRADDGALAGLPRGPFCRVHRNCRTLHSRMALSSGSWRTRDGRMRLCAACGWDLPYFSIWLNGASQPRRDTGPRSPGADPPRGARTRSCPVEAAACRVAAQYMSKSHVCT